MLIKLVKLLGSLIPAEPRLGRKLQEPLTHIITNTPAKSLLYECINTVTTCKQLQRSMIRLCLDKLRTFVEDPDQNLKYLGLLGLNKIMDKNKKAVAHNINDLIFQCVLFFRCQYINFSDLIYFRIHVQTFTMHF